MNNSPPASIADRLTLPGAARLVGVSEITLHRWLKAGKIPVGAYWRVGRCLRFDRQKLLAWRDAGADAAAA